MIRPDQIPDEAVEAAALQIMYTLEGIAEEKGIAMQMTDADIPKYKRVARASLFAALNAWPRAVPEKQLAVREDGEGCCLVPTGNLILPLTQENGDA